jgi:hypothetical protein
MPVHAHKMATRFTDCCHSGAALVFTTRENWTGAVALTMLCATDAFMQTRVAFDNLSCCRAGSFWDGKVMSSKRVLELQVERQDATLRNNNTNTHLQ